VGKFTKILVVFSFSCMVYKIIIFPSIGADKLLSAPLRFVDKSLARPDRKKQLNGRHFSSDAEIFDAAETWLEGQPSELFLSG